MQRVLLSVFALGAFLVLGELTFGPLGAADKPAATVHMKNSAYAPDPVSVAVGQSVEFVNDDDMPHTVTANDKSFDSGNLDAGKTWTYTFTKAGTFTYGCAYHAWMHGTIKVLQVGMAQNVRSEAVPSRVKEHVLP